MLRVSQAAQRLSVSASTVYALWQQRYLRHVRVGAGRGSIRIPEEDLEDYVTKNRVEECEAAAAAAATRLKRGMP